MIKLNLKQMLPFLLMGLGVIFLVMPALSQTSIPELSLTNVAMSMNFVGMNNVGPNGEYYPTVMWYHFEGTITSEVYFGSETILEPVTGYTWIIETKYKRSPADEPLPTEWTVAGSVYADPTTSSYRVSFPMNTVEHDGWKAEVITYCSGSVEYPNGIWTGYADQKYELIEGQLPGEEPTTPLFVSASVHYIAGGACLVAGFYLYRKNKKGGK